MQPEDAIPELYLADGYTDADGAPRKFLLDEVPLALATRFRAAELSPQELIYTIEAVRQLLATDRPDSASALDVTDEALEAVAGLIRQPNNEELVSWIRDCAYLARGPADETAFLAHLQAVVRLYAVLAPLYPASSAPASP